MNDIKTALADYAEKKGPRSHVAIIRAVANRPSTAREIAKATGIPVGTIEQAVIKLCRMEILCRASQRPRDNNRGGQPIGVYALACRPPPAPKKRAPLNPQHRLTMAGQLGLS